MAYTLIVEKTSSCIVFVRDAAVPLYVDDVWSTVAYYKVPWLGNVSAEQRAEPWKWRFTGVSIDNYPIGTAEAARHALDNRRAVLFQSLGRAIDRHRGIGQKAYKHQELVYVAKVTEAEAFTHGNFTQDNVTFPYLADGMEHSSVTMEQEAQAVLMRHNQRLEELRFSEQQRRKYTRSILTFTTDEEFGALVLEIGQYERQG